MRLRTGSDTRFDRPAPHGRFRIGIGTPFLPAAGVKFAKGWQILAKPAFHLHSCGNLVEREAIQNTTYFSGLFNPFLADQLAWDLGYGWGFSYLLGGYIDVNSSPVAYSSSSLNQRFALSYTDNGWDLTANVIWGAGEQNNNIA